MGDSRGVAGLSSMVVGVFVRVMTGDLISGVKINDLLRLLGSSGAFRFPASLGIDGSMYAGCSGSEACKAPHFSFPPRRNFFRVL